jgi:hypothetical protein
MEGNVRSFRKGKFEEVEIFNGQKQFIIKHQFVVC